MDKFVCVYESKMDLSRQLENNWKGREMGKFGIKLDLDLWLYRISVSDTFFIK